MKKIIPFIALVLLAFQSDERVSQLQLPDHFPKPFYSFENSPWANEISELGRKLFYDPILSRDNTISCASCHSPFNAFAHTDHELSHGIENRIGTRNAPALFNLAWNKNFMWDGAISNLDNQALAPMTHPDEMGDTLPNILRRLNKTARYKEAFYQTYGDSIIDTQKLLTALAQFQLNLISDGAKYDEVQRGTKRFSEQESKGYKLFKQHCNSCHAEPTFSSNRFVGNGLPLDSGLLDYGRWKVTGNPQDSFKFKVPSLRNLSFTYPYMHDGRFEKLRQVLDHYSNGIHNNPNLGVELKGGIPLHRNQKKDLIAFLFTLNDTSFVFDPKYSFPQNGS